MVMKDSYKTAGEVYLNRLAKENPEDFQRFRRLAAGKSIVIGGSYDKAQDVLDAMEVTYRLVSAGELGGVALPVDRPVIVNCAGELNPQDIKRISDHVRSGGTLVTTDWALRNLVEQAFPGYVEYNGQSTGDDVVTVELTRIGQALLPETVGAGDKPRWWLEESSYPIRVLDKDKVDVLIRSDHMRDRYGEDAIVVRFAFGKGTVYHLVSHIYLQRAEETSARQRQDASEFVKDKGISVSNVTLMQDQTVGEMEAAYLSIGLLAHIVTKAAAMTAKMSGS